MMDTPPQRSLGTRSSVRQPLPLVVAAVGLAALVYGARSGGVHPPGGDQRDARPAHALAAAETPAYAPETTASLGSASQRPALPPRQEAVPGGRSPAASAAQDRAGPQHPSELDALMARVTHLRAMTPEAAAYIDRVLRDLRLRGAAAVPAIRDLLRRGDDVDFAKMGGANLMGDRTFRQALIDTLEQIGGSEAMAASLEQLQQTTDPIEMVMVARALEKEEPGMHVDEIIHAVGNALQFAEHASARDSPDVSPLFDLLRTYGGEQAVATLRESVPQWGEYALIALAGLPGGAGIPSLTALAGTADGAIANPVLPFRMLAQATAQYPEAGDALVGLARAGEIPDDVWDAMGEALGGKRLEFSARRFDGTPLAENGTGTSGGRPSASRSYYIEWLNVRYEEDVASTGWSPEQVAQQLALIDDLLEAATTPAAKQALQQARASLQPDHRT